MLKKRKYEAALYLGALTLLVMFLHIQPLRSAVLFVTSPLRSLVSTAASDPVVNQTNLDIEQLRSENQLLRQQLEQFEAEKSFLGETKGRVASVVSYTSNPYQHALIVNVGAENGVKKGQAVTYQNILIGKVASVNDSTSIVQLANDPDFRAIIKTSQDVTGLLTGKYDTAIIDRVPRNEPLVQGDLVVTSEADQELPADIVVGRVAAVVDDGSLIKQAQLVSPVGLSSLTVVTIVGAHD